MPVTKTKRNGECFKVNKQFLMLQLVAYIGYIGKDYTNVNHYMDLYAIDDKEFFFRILSWMDNRTIKKSSEELKRQHDKLRRQSSGSKRNQTHIKG